MPGAWGNPLLPQNRPGAGSQGLLEPHSPRWEVGKPAHTSLSVVTSSRRQDDLATWLPLQPPSLTQAEGADSAALARPAPPSPPGVRCPHPRLPPCEPSPISETPRATSPRQAPVPAPSGRAEPGRGLWTQGAAGRTQCSPGKAPPTHSRCRVDFRFFRQAPISRLCGNGRAGRSSVGGSIF